MKTIPLYHVDVFASHAFAGNPAGVCPLGDWPEDAMMQSIAAENHLPATAFFVPEGEGFSIRWFSPVHELELCGHGTVASAFVIFQRLRPSRDAIRFLTRGRSLEVRREGERLALDLPARPAQRATAPPELIEALGATPLEAWRNEANDWMLVLASEEEVRELAPRIDRLAAIDAHGFIVTAPGREVDFVSRFFAPSMGIPEDPATGSTHCTLVPYWAERLGKTKLRTRQVSKRGGDLACELRSDRVIVAGQAVLFMEGSIQL